MLTVFLFQLLPRRQHHTSKSHFELRNSLMSHSPPYLLQKLHTNKTGTNIIYSIRNINSKSMFKMMATLGQHGLDDLT